MQVLHSCRTPSVSQVSPLFVVFVVVSRAGRNSVSGGSKFIGNWKHCHGMFTPVLAKHSKSFNLIDTLCRRGRRIQRNFEPMQQWQVDSWRQTQISDECAKLILYEAFVESELEAPRSLLPEVHRLYFNPQYPEFAPRTMWSLANAFTSAFKTLDPIPQFKATAKLGAFLAKLPA